MEVSSKPLSSNPITLEPQFGSNKSENKQERVMKAEQDTVSISAEAFVAFSEDKDGSVSTLGTGVTPPPPPPPPPGTGPVEE